MEVRSGGMQVTGYLFGMLLLAAACIAPLGSTARAAGAEGRWHETLLDAGTEAGGQPPPACTVWRSNCEACDFHPDGTFDCSTPGIACVPESWSCMTFTPAGADEQPPE